MEFNTFAQRAEDKFNAMSSKKLYVVGAPKELVWDKYLNSFPEGTNEIYITNREHDCNCCKNFIRDIGNVVSIEDGEIVSIWDIEADGEYGIVTKALSEFVKSFEISDVFIHEVKTAGSRPNIGGVSKIPTREELLKKDVVFNHFFARVPRGHLSTSKANTIRGNARSTKAVFKRALDELTINSAELALELIAQGSLYRGEEKKDSIVKFMETKIKYDSLKTESDKMIFCWQNISNKNDWFSFEEPSRDNFRTSVTGTLLVDLASGKSLDDAAAAFGSKMEGYKKPLNTIVSPRMIADAMAKIEELGLRDYLQRRFAHISDVSVNNVLFMDRSISGVMKDSLEEMLLGEVKVSDKSFDKIEEIAIEKFISDVLPNINSIELMVDNKHEQNLVSLIAPTVKGDARLFQWNNDFSFSYNGNAADAMKQRVKDAGGNIEADLRFSIQWNDGDNNQNDFDAHAYEPNGNGITYRTKGKIHPSSGHLDVDITTPGGRVAVENITWKDKKRMPDGIYELVVHNFSHNGGTTGFTAQVEFDGVVHSFEYDRGLRQDEKVVVAQISYSKAKGFSILKSLPSDKTSKMVWGVPTNKFVKVTSMMMSPNFWDDNKSGNKHFIFTLDGCNNPDEARGMYNEFLRNDLTAHRKVFEILGRKTMCQPIAEEQLSGLGFSSTLRNEIVCKVSGNFTRTLKIKF